MAVNARAVWYVLVGFGLSKLYYGLHGFMISSSWTINPSNTCQILYQLYHWHCFIIELGSLYTWAEEPAKSNTYKRSVFQQISQALFINQSIEDASLTLAMGLQDHLGLLPRHTPDKDQLITYTPVSSCLGTSTNSPKWLFFSRKVTTFSGSTIPPLVKQWACCLLLHSCKFQGHVTRHEN